MSEGTNGATSAPAEWSLTRLKSISRLPLQPTPNPTLIEVNEWVWPSHCHQHEAVLRHGQLLRWMDVAACLSGKIIAQFDQHSYIFPTKGSFTIFIHVG